jgi:sarcosine oxidase, subunit beta
MMNSNYSRTADVVIIGGGVNGAATAFFLAKMGAGRILILDRAWPAAGASSRGMGLLRTYHANDPEAELAIRSNEIFRNWGSTVGGDCGFNQTGFLYLENASRRAAVQANVDRVNRLGGEAYLLDSDELKKLQPFMNTETSCAAWEPRCGCAYGAHVTDSFLTAAARIGVTLSTRNEVHSILERDGKIIGVDTQEGRIEAGTVILAAGAWSGALARTIGLNLPVIPRRLSIGRVHLPPEVVSPATFLDAEFDTSFRPEATGLATISMRDTRYGTPIDPVNLRDDVEEQAVREGIKRLSVRIPVASRAVGGRSWSGVDGFTPDLKGIYGKVPGLDGLLVCAGASEKGFKVSPAVGLGLSTIVLHGSCLWLENPAFAVDRFNEAHSTQDLHKEISVSALI